MTGASYIPGTWLGVVRSGTAVLLGPETPAELAGALWELLAGRPEPHEVLAAVTSSSGGSLARIPSFGILDFNGPLRVFLRGDLDLRVEQPGGAVDLDGRDVTTWNERRFAVPGMCRLGIADGGSADQPELPLGEGVVLLQALALGVPAGPAAVDNVGEAGKAVAVDTPGTGPDEDAGAAARSTSPGHAEHDDLPRITLLPEHEASAETMLALPDEDQEGLPLNGGHHPEAVGEAADPDATIAPGAIIPPDLADAFVAGEAVEPEDDAPSAGHSDAADAAPAVEMTTSYDHLWDRTVMRNIEDAAVREDPDADSGLVAVNMTPALPAAEQLPALDAAGDMSPAGQESGSGAQPETGSAGAEGTDPAASTNVAPTPDPGPDAQAPAGVLIDSVPWRTGGAASAPASAASTPSVGTPPAFAPPAGAEGPANPGPAPAFPASQPPAAGTPDQAPAAGFDPDHDGQTVMKSSLGGMAPQPAAPATVQDTASGPLVLARVCAHGHPNPPTRAQCSACGESLLPDAVQVARPRLGRVRLSTGDLLDLDQSMVIGRQPSVSRVQGGVMPRLVQVASPGGDISRSHVEVRLEGWHVMLCDLKATNGTILVREGQPPRRLAQNEMAILLDGDIAELGDNISLRFEEIP
ncbi:FHA domain-containing protein [Pseudarthrobacter sp. fls2-241-R2A-127]|uniref:FHA domain-containing protein n=1 Tax=Pseudarthrobacter sp. fls2-241-R2A-127 TaxID=3040303 RepID=UPI00255215DD|nr:FHA domain-containing protein [Pseudarthrobacter sp. fls2-241-R2A-127]